jgi:hypothetical protein
MELYFEELRVLVTMWPRALLANMQLGARHTMAFEWDRLYPMGPRADEANFELLRAFIYSYFGKCPQCEQRHVPEEHRD